MKFTSPLLLLVGGITASAAVIAKRTPSSFRLYAYGVGIGGLPVYYSDGKFSPSPSNEWVITPTNTKITLTLTNSTLTNSTLITTPALTINLSRSTGLTNIGFSGSSNTASETTTQGFIAYGKWVLWQNPSTQDMASHFFATPLCDGVWQLRWNAEEIEDGKSVSVAVRMMAPSA
ncbi:hypothetical protein DSL72_006356 [Monilinia vaccinii-corymbosi]|uniref:Ubiquitin 3 binding protein But2 C-terminal domain-containing protein n=1 Tax=Monilinia vaccinii-corymbosi TaxID=61207 RepID=A0A8A3PM05_9HELO|nr:hypothetical protein DSL72_006356 [Monilinia vaccinii-corymbosi]